MHFIPSNNMSAAIATAIATATPTHYLILMPSDRATRARMHEMLDGVLQVQVIRGGIIVDIRWHRCHKEEEEEGGDDHEAMALYCSTIEWYGDVAVHEHTKRMLGGQEGVKYLVTKALVRHECLLVDDARLPT